MNEEEVPQPAKVSETTLLIDLSHSGDSMPYWQVFRVTSLPRSRTTTTLEECVMTLSHIKVEHLADLNLLSQQRITAKSNSETRYGVIVTEGELRQLKQIDRRRAKASETAKTKAVSKAVAEKVAADAKHNQRLADAYAEAKATGRRVWLNTYTRPARESEDCTCVEVTVWAMPDGTTTLTEDTTKWS